MAHCKFLNEIREMILQVYSNVHSSSSLWAAAVVCKAQCTLYGHSHSVVVVVVVVAVHSVLTTVVNLAFHQYGA